MKNYGLIILAFILTCTSQAQSFWDDVTISAQLAVAHHDKRLIGYSETFIQEYQNRTPETWGTWQYGVDINKRIFHIGSVFEVGTGLGYSFEHLTFYRPIDHCYYKPGEPCHEIFVNSDDYWIQQVAIPVNILFAPVGNLGINLGVRSSFSTHKAFSANYSSWMFEFYTLEINPGLNYQLGKYSISLNYRLWQWKKIDRALFSLVTIPATYNPDPILIDTYEQNNLVKLWFSVGYQLGNPDHSRK